MNILVRNPSMAAQSLQKYIDIQEKESFKFITLFCIKGEGKRLAQVLVKEMKADVLPVDYDRVMYDVRGVRLEIREIEHYV